MKTMANAMVEQDTNKNTRLTTENELLSDKYLSSNCTADEINDTCDQPINVTRNLSGMNGSSVHMKQQDSLMCTIEEGKIE